jgi:hypothetical protein
MKKIIKKFWGVAFIVAMLSTLFVGAVPQASAGALYVSTADLPNSAAHGITANSTEIYQFVVGYDNTTVYAATSNGPLKSINGGRTWSMLTSLGFPDYDDATNDVDNPPDGVDTHLQVAVAPDDVNYVAFMDQYSGNVSLSTDGGTTFHSLGRAQDAEGLPATTLHNYVYDIAISAIGQIAIVAAGGGYVTDHVVAVAGTDGTLAALYYCLPSSMGDGHWKNAVKNTSQNGPILGHGYTGTDGRFIAVEFSPNFAQDDIAYLVATSTAATVNAYLDVVNFNNAAFNNQISAFGGYASAGMALGTTDLNTYTCTAKAFGGNITRAQIVFASTYSGLDETTRLAYISIAAGSNQGVNSGGVWRVTDSGAIPGGNLPMFAPLAYYTLPAWAISSIALSADDATLVAVAMEDNRVWTITTLAAGMYAVATPNNAMKRIGVVSYDFAHAGADNQTVAYAGANLLDAKQGTEGAFSLSINDGYVFNDISLVRTTLVTIDDQVIAPDGGQRYVVSCDNSTVSPNGHTSVFFWDSTYWERHLTLDLPVSHGFVAKASPTNFDILYLGDKYNCNVYYTASAGAVNWKAPTAPRLGSSLADLEVESDAKVYVATNINGVGYVSTLTNNAQVWHVATKATFFAVSATDTLASLTIVSPSNVIAGSTQGRIAWSTAADDPNATWSCSAQLSGGGNTYADAVSLGSYSYIYTVFDGTVAVYYWIINYNTSWTGYIAFAGTATQNMQGILIYPHTATGAVYVISSNGSPASTLSRAFMPAFGTPGSDEWASTSVGGYAGQAPDVLKLSAGNQIWWIDTYGALGPPGLNTYLDRVRTYTDILYAQFPAPSSPQDKYLIQVNKQTGEAYDVTLIWTNVANSYYTAPIYGGAYELEVAKDKDFSILVLDENHAGTIDSAYAKFHQIIGPHQGSPWQLEYQPGETYYWRVRVSSPLYSQWSTAYTLEVQPAPPPVPDLNSPINGLTVSTLSPGFSWSVMSGEAPASGITMTYTFQLATDAAFSTTSMVYTTKTTVAGLSLPTTTTLTDGKQYFWRVQTTTSVSGDWSTVANFIVSIPKFTTPVTVIQTQTSIALTQTNPPVTSITVTAPVTTTTTEVSQAYIWVIIIIGAVLVIAIIVLIVRTRRVG